MNKYHRHKSKELGTRNQGPAKLVKINKCMQCATIFDINKIRGTGVWPYYICKNC